MTRLPTTVNQAQARRIALAAQGFGQRRPGPRPDWRRLRQAIERMALLQLDSVNVLARSHYLPAFSRVGSYDLAKLDHRTFHPRHRVMFEYWAHEASLLPLAMHPLLRWRMAAAARGEDIYKGYVTFARERSSFVSEVLAEVRDRGPLSARELSNGSPRTGPWWGRSDGKIALEYLFWTGEITAATRRGFERIYDLTERALPAEILSLPTPPAAEAQRALVEIAARALGIATETDLRDYFRLPVAAARQSVQDLVEAGSLLPVQVADWRHTAYLHKDARKPRRIRGSALLSPFDPLVWERARTERLFDFRYRIEIYTPAPKRQYGYYVLPFLLDERLVGRVDLKADRQAGVLRVLAAYGEPGHHPGTIAEALADELRQLAEWLGLESLTVRRRGDLAPTLATLLDTNA